MPTTEQLRRTMIDRQIVSRGIKSPHVLAAMRNVPREAFLPDELAEFAYEDSALSIEAGQTISQPYIVALMIDAAGIETGDTVFEIGAGSGYADAILGPIAEKALDFVRHEDLAHLALNHMGGLGQGKEHIPTG